MLKLPLEIVVFFRSNTKTNATLHAQKLTMVTSCGARQQTTTTPTGNGEIVKMRFSRNIL